MVENPKHRKKKLIKNGRKIIPGMILSRGHCEKRLTTSESVPYTSSRNLVAPFSRLFNESKEKEMHTYLPTKLCKSS